MYSLAFTSELCHALTWLENSTAAAMPSRHHAPSVHFSAASVTYVLANEFLVIFLFLTLSSVWT